ncbi:hypothetical protein M3Y94_00481100 [Aphelenchoides besseyi]|nr:hypothetical protein M3Y94_00481100 [Aphelenchoides besseyi]KAI6217446.1 hypothetical protein M3Y95_01219800 [Aphelenchoides besseyi]
MKVLAIFLLTLLVVVVTIGQATEMNELFGRAARVKRDCWNYITGSRCDNEAFYKVVGYKTCANEYGPGCRKKGYKGARCSKFTESCFGMKRNSNVCQCYK